MDALDNLAKIFVKFYICQIHSSISYSRYKKSQQNYEELIEDQINLMNEESNNDLDNKTNSNLISKKENDIQMKTEEEDDKEKFPKKLFVFKNKIFSRVEIQGLIVQIQARGLGDNLRKIIYLDDTTGIIQVIIWNNKMSNIFNQIDKVTHFYT